jgi:hypothetical protein
VSRSSLGKRKFTPWPASRSRYRGSDRDLSGRDGVSAFSWRSYNTEPLALGACSLYVISRIGRIISLTDTDPFYVIE